MLIAIHAAVLLVLVLLGLLFRSGRGAGLIAGYNTMPPEERAKWDEKALCRFMGKLMLALAACWLLVLLSAVLEQIALLAVGLVLFLLLIAAGVVYANTGRRFRK